MYHFTFRNLDHAMLFTKACDAYTMRFFDTPSMNTVDYDYDNEVYTVHTHVCGEITFDRTMMVDGKTVLVCDYDDFILLECVAPRKWVVHSHKGVSRQMSIVNAYHYATQMFFDHLGVLDND